MSDEDDRGRVERKARGPMGDGKPTNAREQAAILEKARAEYVLRWRANPRVCADRPDSLSAEKWYGDGSSWTEERIKAALDEAVFDPRIERKAAARPKLEVVVPSGAVVKAGAPKAADKERTLTALKPWEEAGVSRRTWYRNRPKEG
jgi:hypothetical protein